MKAAGPISGRCWKPIRACSSQANLLFSKKLLAQRTSFCIVTLLLESKMEPKADIALIGLAVMGQNLILNMNDHGYTVVAFKRTVAKVDEFINREAKGTNVMG